MILLNRAMCSKNLRKVGIIHASINLFFQSILLIGFIIALVMLEHGYTIKTYADGQIILTDYGYDQHYPTHILVFGIYVTVLCIILYSMLIYGLIRRISAALTAWLCFAGFEFIFLQIFLSLLSFGSNALPYHGIGILFVTIQMIIGAYMVYNMSIVCSARHEFLQTKKLNNRFSICPPENTTPRLFNTTASPKRPHAETAVQRTDYHSVLSECMPSSSFSAAPNHHQMKPSNQQYSTPTQFNTSGYAQTAVQLTDYHSVLNEVMPSSSFSAGPSHHQMKPSNQQYSTPTKINTTASPTIPRAQYAAPRTGYNLVLHEAMPNNSLFAAPSHHQMKINNQQYMH